MSTALKTAFVTASVLVVAGVVVAGAWAYFGSVADDALRTKVENRLNAHYPGTSVERCLPVSEPRHGTIFICSFYVMSRDLTARLSGGATRPTRVACVMHRASSSDSDPLRLLGFASPDRLLPRERCAKAIAAVMREPVRTLS